MFTNRTRFYYVYPIILQWTELSNTLRMFLHIHNWLMFLMRKINGIVIALYIGMVL